MLEGMILKPNMVLPGLTCAKQETVDEVADATVRVSAARRPGRRPRDCVPVGRPIRRTGLGAFERHECQVQGARARLPWALVFSFARAIQHPALEIWRGEEANRLAAQQALYHRARCNRAARRGEYSAAMETPELGTKHVASAASAA